MHPQQNLACFVHAYNERGSTCSQPFLKHLKTVSTRSGLLLIECLLGLVVEVRFVLIFLISTCLAASTLLSILLVFSFRSHFLKSLEKVHLIMAMARLHTEALKRG